MPACILSACHLGPSYLISLCCADLEACVPSVEYRLQRTLGAVSTRARLSWAIEGRQVSMCLGREMLGMGCSDQKLCLGIRDDPV